MTMIESTAEKLTPTQRTAAALRDDPQRPPSASAAVGSLESATWGPTAVIVAHALGRQASTVAARAKRDSGGLRKSLPGRKQAGIPVFKSIGDSRAISQ